MQHKIPSLCCCSIAQSRLTLHGLQHASLPCPSPSLGVCSNSCPLSRWCHLIISSSGRIWLWRSTGFDYRISTGLGKQRLLGAQTKPCAHQDLEEWSSDPIRDWARLACECLGVSLRGVVAQRPAVGSGAWEAAFLGDAACWHKSSWRRSPLGLRQTL